MSITKRSVERPRVVCHVDGSSTAAAVVSAAGSYCRQRGAELVAVWVLEPSSLRQTPPCSTGGTGIWGLSGAAAVALGRARKQGVPTRAVVRIGDPGRVLDEERRAVGAERVFTRADVAAEATADHRGPSRPPVSVSRRAASAARSRPRSRRTSPSARRRGR
jgi:hypothetical protein